MFELHPVRRDPEVRGERPLEPDRDVAQPERVMALIEQRLRHEAGGVREIDEPGARRADVRGQLGKLEHDRDGAERLRESSGSGGLLPDHVELERDRLVLVARLVAADP